MGWPIITMFQKGKPINDIVEVFGMLRNYTYVVSRSDRSVAMPRGGVRKY